MTKESVIHGKANDLFGLNPINELLLAVAESLPSAVLSSDERTRMADLAQGLPSYGLESTFGFESRLDERRPRCDLFLSAQCNSRFSKYLVALGQGSNATSARRGMAAFLSEVATPSSALAEVFGTIILEYDVGSSRAWKTRFPGVFLEPRQAVAQDGDTLLRLGQVPFACGAELLAASVCLAAGRQRQKVETEALAKAIDALPESSGLLHIGAMPSRRPRAIRIVFSMVESEVANFLSKMRWRGDLTRLAELVAAAAQLQDSQVLTIACDIVSGRVANRIGLEIHLKDAWAEARASQWVPIFSGLMSRGWSRQDKAEALLAWPKRDTLVSSSGTLSLLTGVNHVKLVLDDARVYSKAYIGAFLGPQ